MDPTIRLLNLLNSRVYQSGGLVEGKFCILPSDALKAWVDHRNSVGTGNGRAQEWVRNVNKGFNDAIIGGYA